MFECAFPFVCLIKFVIHLVFRDTDLSFRHVEDDSESTQGFELLKVELNHGFSGYGLAGQKSTIKMQFAVVI